MPSTEGTRSSVIRDMVKDYKNGNNHPLDEFLAEKLQINEDIEEAINAFFDSSPSREDLLIAMKIQFTLGYIARDKVREHDEMKDIIEMAKKIATDVMGMETESVEAVDLGPLGVAIMGSVKRESGKKKDGVNWTADGQPIF